MGTVRVTLDAARPAKGRIDPRRVDATTEADTQRHAAADDAASAQDAAAYTRRVRRRTVTGATPQARPTSSERLSDISPPPPRQHRPGVPRPAASTRLSSSDLSWSLMTPSSHADRSRTRSSSALSRASACAGPPDRVLNASPNPADGSTARVACQVRSTGRPTGPSW